MPSHNTIDYNRSLELMSVTHIFKDVINSWTKNSEFIQAVTHIKDMQTLLDIYREIYDCGYYSYGDIHKVKRIHREFSRQNPGLESKSYDYLVQFDKYFKYAVNAPKQVV